MAQFYNNRLYRYILLALAMIVIHEHTLCDSSIGGCGLCPSISSSSILCTTSDTYNDKSYDYHYIKKPIEFIKVVNQECGTAELKVTIPDNTLTYIHFVPLNLPRAIIKRWHPGTYGNTRHAMERNIKDPLPIYVHIGFDQPVSQTFIDDFINNLRSIHVIFRHVAQHRQFKGQYIIIINPNYTQNEVLSLLNLANLAMAKKISEEKRIYR